MLFKQIPAYIQNIVNFVNVGQRLGSGRRFNVCMFDQPKEIRLIFSNRIEKFVEPLSKSLYARIKKFSAFIGKPGGVFN